MKIVHWNISYGSKKEKVLETIMPYINDSEAIICLEEVQPSIKVFLIDKLLEFNGERESRYAYSLDYRQPGKFDSKNRFLGVMMICSPSMYIVESGVFNRTPFPDRTLYAEVLCNGELLKIACFHSITGCAYSKAKSTQFFSFAETIEFFKPDIVTIDANEPKIDHWNPDEVVYYDNKDHGVGAKTFFKTMEDCHLIDTFKQVYNRKDFELGKPLTPSVKVRGKGYCRYDFICANIERFSVDKCNYLYQAGIEGTSDHAIVEVELEMLRNRDRGTYNGFITEQSMFPYNKLQERHLLKYCRYYGKEHSGNSKLMAEYERHWIEDMINNKCDCSDYVNGYDLNWLQTFNVEDGVPLGLKALLFNRYFHWSSYVTVDSFKRWYLDVYLTGKYGQ